MAAAGMLALAASGIAVAANPSTSLADLVRTGDRDAALAAISAPGTDVNAKLPDGSTALMWATFKADHELVHALLKAGAKADVTNKYGDTALTEAIHLQDMDLFHALLDAGADVDSPNLDHQTALMLAINVKNEQMARELIAHGANVRAIETFRNQTPLMWAAAGDLPDIVDLLLAKGAASQVNLRAKFDDWPRQMTSEPRAQFASRQTGGLTALLYATRSGCLRCAESLVKAGADVNRPNPDGVTPLINAIDNKHFDIAMFLLDKGADPNTWDKSGRTPVYMAVDMNSYRGGGFGGFRGGAVRPGGIGGVVAGPGARGPGAGDAAPQKGPTAMDVVNRLIGMGVDVNHQLTEKRPYGNGRGRFTDYDMRDGAGPLFIATLSHDHVAMKTLLEHGAEVDLNNVFDMTPLMIACGMRATGRRFGGGGGDAQAIQSVDLLLDAGANINAQVTGTHTHSATIMAYVAGRDQEGKTALMAAAEDGDARLVQHLLERGADPMIKDEKGKTALDFARTKPPPPRGGAAAAPARPPGAAGGRGGAQGGGREAAVKILEEAMAKAGGVAATPAI